MIATAKVDICFINVCLLLTFCHVEVIQLAYVFNVNIEFWKLKNWTKSLVFLFNFQLNLHQKSRSRSHLIFAEQKQNNQNKFVNFKKWLNVIELKLLSLMFDLKYFYLDCFINYQLQQPKEYNCNCNIFEKNAYLYHLKKCNLF